MNYYKMCPFCEEHYLEKALEEHQKYCSDRLLQKIVSREDDLDVAPGRKFDQGKNRLDLIPPRAEWEVGRVLTYGAEKYDDENWRKVADARRRYLGAARRHLNEFQRGEAVDKDSNCHHLACAIVSLMFVLELELET